MKSLEDALEFYARKMDAAHAETVAANFSRMVADNLSAEAIDDFQKIEADTYEATRIDMLAKLREWLERGGETLQ